MSTSTDTSTGTGAGSKTATRLLQRQIFPIDRDGNVFPLYVDTAPQLLDADKYEVGGRQAARDLNNAAIRQNVSGTKRVHPDQILGRTAIRIPAEETLSFGTYFNGFAAGYWRRHTVVKAVTLTVGVKGRGARVIVFKSQANGRTQQVESSDLTTGDESTFAFELTLKPFVDGGWYWYDVTAGDEDAVVTSAEWTAEVPADRATAGTVDVAITTMNRPDFCAKLIGQFADDALAPYLDTVFVMEQGTQKVADSEFFPEAAAALGEKLHVIEQGNLGGSGGYARGQLESLKKGTATYALMMDDDVICEPDGVVRAVTFADLAKKPTIVGGHMFNIYSRSRMHSFGEVVLPWRFWWQSAPGVYPDWDFAARNLRSARWLHKRYDVDYNGWFMCLIPRQVISEIGLSLPLFLKWDDSEYGLRARGAGYPTVTLPGAAVWHIPWSDKNDALDWQSYFHHRNRFVAALLHSAYPNGGRMIQESLNHQIKHLVSMQYSTVAIRHQALLDVLAGPEQLHHDLPTKLGEIRAMVKEFPDAQLAEDRDLFPPIRRHKPPRKGSDDSAVPTLSKVRFDMLKAPLRQLMKVRPLSREYPEAELPAMDSQWFRIAKYDSVIVSMNDGQSAAMYQRDPQKFRDLLKQTLEIHARLRREWDHLAQEYRSKLGVITSPETWEDTFRPWIESTDD